MGRSRLSGAPQAPAAQLLLLLLLGLLALCSTPRVLGELHAYSWLRQQRACGACCDLS